MPNRSKLASSLPHYQLKWLLNEFRANASLFEENLHIVDFQFINGLIDTKSISESEHIDRIARAFALIEESGQRARWDLSSKSLSTFLVHQVCRLHLNDELPSDIVDRLRNTEIMGQIAGFARLFSPQPQQLEPPKREEMQALKPKAIPETDLTFAAKSKIRAGKNQFNRNLEAGDFGDAWIPISPHYLFWLLERAQDFPDEFPNNVFSLLHRVQIALNLNSTHMEIGTISKMLLLLWRLGECPPEQVPWLGRVTACLSNFVIFQIAPVLIEKGIPDLIIRRMMACRLLTTNDCFRTDRT